MVTVMTFGAVQIEDRVLPYVASVEGNGPVLIAATMLQTIVDDQFVMWVNGDLMIGGYRLRWLEVRPGNIVAFELLNRKPVMN